MLPFFLYDTVRGIGYGGQGVRGMEQSRLGRATVRHVLLRRGLRREETAGNQNRAESRQHWRKRGKGQRRGGWSKRGRERTGPVPSVISEGNAKGAARTHAHTQKRARRQNRPSMASTAAEGPPWSPSPAPQMPRIPHETISSYDHKGHGALQNQGANTGARRA